jgi:hypothetical protein
MDIAENHVSNDNAPAARREEILIVPGHFPRQVAQAIRSLAATDDNIFQQTQELVRVIHEPERGRQTKLCDGRPSTQDACHACAANPGEPCVREHRAGRSMVLRPGTPRLCSISPAVLKERLAIAADWYAPKEEEGETKGSKVMGKKFANPPADVVANVHERKEWPGIRPIRGIIEAPALRPDFTIIEEPGYDEATAFYYSPSVNFPRVPRSPTQADAAAAMRRLWIEMFCDFPYRGMPDRDPADVDRTARYAAACNSADAFVGVSMLLSILARPAIEGAVPSGAFEAASQGSGKTKQIHAVAVVATGRPAGVATFPMRNGKANEEELEKVLAGYALAGAVTVAFDNIRGTLGGSALEKVQTAVETVDLRILGKSGQPSLPWSAVVMSSGNNMSMTSDVADRTLVSRLESSREDPRSRPSSDFKHANLLAALKIRRPALLRDALTVLRAYVLAPRDVRESLGRECGTLGSFEAWAELIPRAIRYAGGPNVLDARMRGEATDGEGAAHETLMRCWPDCFAEWTKASDLVKHAFKEEAAIKSGQVAPDGMDDLRGAIRQLTNTPDGRLPNPTTFGNEVLRALRGKWRGDAKIVRSDKPDRNGVALWRVERRGAVAPPPPPPEPTTPPPFEGPPPEPPPDSCEVPVDPDEPDPDEVAREVMRAPSAEEAALVAQCKAEADFVKRE